MKKVPPLELVHKWVRGLKEGAKNVMDGTAPLNPSSAMQVQAALVAQLVVGNECTSPLRLSIIRSLVHPNKV